jgi:signal transduction histidine kinase
MKLINKISLFFFISCTVIFIVFVIILARIIEYSITEEADEQLIHIYKNTVRELSHGKEISFPPFIEIKVIQNNNISHGFRNIFIELPDENDSEPFREYSSSEYIKGKLFNVTVRISWFEKEETISSILKMTFLGLFILLIIMFLLNKFFSQKIFKNFYSTLDKLQSFSVSGNSSLQLEKSNIKEFNQLNDSVFMLSENARAEYQSLKEFTEETNHEIQTPVAVAKAKLEILLQKDNLTQNEISMVSVALSSLNKLERINKSILLLNKLSHKKLFDNASINIGREIKTILTLFEDYIESMEIDLALNIHSDTVITADQSLINIMLSNIISNAIKHNMYKGKIIIEVDKAVLRIKNTGAKLNKDPEKMFRRFEKGNSSAESSGLGLAIVKQICNLYNFYVTYNTKDIWHEIELKF